MHRIGSPRPAFIWPPHGAVAKLPELLRATGMIGVMMCEQNAGQRLLMLLQPGQNRCGIARIDDPAALIAGQQPDVVVIEAGKGDGILHECVTAGLGVSIIAPTCVDGLL